MYSIGIGFILCYITMLFGAIINHIGYKHEMKLLDKQKEVSSHD